MTTETVNRIENIKIPCKCTLCQKEYIVGIEQICSPCMLIMIKPDPEIWKKRKLQKWRKFAYALLIIISIVLLAGYYTNTATQVIAAMCLAIGQLIEPLTTWLAKKI